MENDAYKFERCWGVSENGEMVLKEVYFLKYNGKRITNIALSGHFPNIKSIEQDGDEVVVRLKGFVGDIKKEG